jgi:hypothetical protein
MHEEIWAQSWRWNKDLIWKCRINRAAKSAPWFHLWIVHRRAITRLYLSIRLWLNFCCPTCYYFYTYYWIICCNNIMYSTTLSNSKKLADNPEQRITWTNDDFKTNQKFFGKDRDKSNAYLHTIISKSFRITASLIFHIASSIPNLIIFRSCHDPICHSVCNE